MFAFSNYFVVYNYIVCMSVGLLTSMSLDHIISLLS